MITPSFIYFDLDNTLVDHDEALRVALRQLCSRMPGWLSRRTFEEIHAEFIRFNGDLWEEYGAGRISPETLRSERSRMLAGYCDPDGRDFPVERITEEYAELYIASTRRVDGALGLVEMLASGYRLGIISNGFAAWQRRKLMLAGLDAFFDTIVLSEEVAAMKPDAMIFDAAIRMAGCDPGDILVVGDSYRHDILGALRAGMKAVWYNPHRHPIPDIDPDYMPDGVITSLHDLPALLPPIPSA